MTNGLETVNVFSELERVGVVWTAASPTEVRLRCPVHEDVSPSASLNTKDLVWKCFVPSCGASGDFVSLLAYVQKQERRLVLADLQKRYNLSGVSTIPSQTVEKFARSLSEAGPLLAELEKRGVTAEMMREARLGFYEGRITIPVFDSAMRCVNVRRYLPGAPGPQKMRNTSGHGSPVLYRIETLREAKRVLICGGEMKALVAGHLLKQHGIAALCSTGGEGHWKDEWSSDIFKGREVYVCMDVDDPGVAAARRICMSLYGHAAVVKNLQLPIDKVRFPKGDINDWVGQCGATGVDLLMLIDGSAEWVPPQKQLVPKGEVRKLELQHIVTNKNVGERIEVDAVISAADQTPYLIPHEVDVECTRDQALCHLCPVKMLPVDVGGWSRTTVESGSQAILGMLGVSDKEQRDRICEALGIPSCKAVKFHTRTHQSAHDVRLTAPLKLDGGRVGDTWYPAIVVSSKAPELNVPYRLTGVVYPHPRSQQATALINTVEELEGTLASFKCSEEELDELRVFQPAGDGPQQLELKVNSLLADLETNVTWIYKRADMHLAIDLAFHSPLSFLYNQRQINGWLNLLIVGDSAQGKSEAVARMMSHYGVGDKVDCKNATTAGLLGGLEQAGTRWFVRWGAIPTRDGMLVVLEELKGAPVEVIGKLTEMRSSGIAEIPKIERRRALARTRVIAISNPRTPRPMASFHFGVEAIVELIGSLEDVRRFDLAIAVGRDEVSDEAINSASAKKRKVSHLATATLSRRLILWAWTRKPEHIEFTEEAGAAILEVAKKLTSKYSESVPLVDKGTIQLKLARLSAALAARLFSTTDGVNLRVLSSHVNYIGKFVDRVYSSKVMGYGEFSSAQELMSKVQDPHIIEKQIRSTKHPRDLAGVLLRRDTISIEDIQSATSMDFQGARDLLSLLVRKGALLRTSRTEYSKNPEFIEILKKVRATQGEEQDTEGDDF